MSTVTRPVEPDRLQAIVDRIVTEIGAMDDRGTTTSRIGPLEGIDTDLFGMAILTCEGEMIAGGDADTPFSIQSISKLFALKLVLDAYHERLWERVGREPSGDPFNSIIDLERHEGFPRNPFINAGALVVVDMLLDHYGPEDELDAVIDFVRDLLDGDDFTINDEVAVSDEEGAHLNRALVSLAKHFGNVRNPLERVMRAYSRQCAIELTCRQLARAGRFLMLGGFDDVSSPKGDVAREARRIASLMMTCGQYDGSGEFAYRVGLPAKSGVGGGIVAVVPNTASIAVWSPGLDDSGNSRLGTLALEMLTDEIEWSVFGAIRTR